MIESCIVIGAVGHMVARESRLSSLFALSIGLGTPEMAIQTRKFVCVDDNPVKGFGCYMYT
jgi:hypothetical protein